MSRGLRVGPASRSMKNFHAFKSHSAQHTFREVAASLLSSNFIVEHVVTDNEKQKARRRASLIALGVVFVLFVLGWFLTRELYSNQKIEDCVLSGRTNCVPIDTPSSY